jgi:hypothetical protein
LATAAVGVWLVFVLVFGTTSAVVGGSISRAAGFWLDPKALIAVFVALVVPFVRMLHSPYWVRLSPTGLQIGAAHRRAVLLPWAGVDYAAGYGRSIFATVHVVPDPRPRLWNSQVRAGHR